MLLKITTGLCLLLIYFQASAEIYKWVDEQGNTHYGDKPVGQSEQVEVDTERKGHLTSSSTRKERQQRLMESFDEDREREEKEKAEDKKQKRKKQKQCNAAKDRLRRIKKSSYLYDLDEKGNRVALPQEVRQKEIDDLNKNLKKHCK